MVRPTFSARRQRVLFSIAGFLGDFLGGPDHALYEITANDQRFVMLRPVQQQGELILIENFLEELRAKVGNE